MRWRPGRCPHHCFHVFAVYPWLGLMRTGVVDEPLRILDQCRTTPGSCSRSTATRPRCSRRRSGSRTATCGSAPPAPRVVRWRDDGRAFVPALRAGRPRLAALGLRLRPALPGGRGCARAGESPRARRGRLRLVSGATRRPCRAAPGRARAADRAASARTWRRPRTRRPRASRTGRRRPAAPLSPTATTARPIAASPSSVTTPTSGCSSCSWAARVRAGRSCPSPTLAVRIKTRSGTRGSYARGSRGQLANGSRSRGLRSQIRAMLRTPRLTAAPSHSAFIACS